MNQRYESRKEYSLMDVLQYNLRKWWLAAVFAAVFAVIVLSLIHISDPRDGATSRMPSSA